MTADEVELKFLEIDKQAVQQQLETLGAEKIYSRELRSVGFEADGYSLRGRNDKHVLRVRQIGDETRLTHKGPSTSEHYKNRPETEITSTSGFEEAVAFLERLGFRAGKETTKHRTHYAYGDTHFEIDEAPGIPPYLEIETPSEQRMDEVCEILGLDVTKGKNKTIALLYPEHTRTND